MHKKIRSEIRKRYEAGEDLISLSIEYKVNYGTLKNISSKEKWEKGKLEKLVYYKEIFEIANLNKEKREIVKEEYKQLTEKMRKQLLEDDKSDNIKVIQEARRAKSQAIKELYIIDKELHGMETDLEKMKYQLEYSKYLLLKQELEGQENNEEGFIGYGINKRKEILSKMRGQIKSPMEELKEAKEMLLKAKGVKK